MEWRWMKRLSEDIRMIVSTDNMYELDEALLDLITRRVTINLYVFRAFMKHRIRGYIYRGLTITVKTRWSFLRETQIPQELSQPLHLTSCNRHGAILCLGRRMRHYFLFLCFPRNWRTSYHDNISSQRPSS